jgi:chromate reductase
MSRPRAECPFIGKPVAVIGASTGMFGAVWAQAEARKVLGAIGARVIDRELPVPTADEALADGLDPALATELAEILSELVQTAEPAAVAA